jgi:hypothetical protein
MINRRAPSVVPAQNRAHDAPVLFRDETAAGIALQKQSDAFFGIIPFIYATPATRSKEPSSAADPQADKLES